MEMRMDCLDLGITEQTAKIGAASVANALYLRRIERSGGLPHVGGKHLVGPGKDIRHIHAIARLALGEPRSEVPVDLMQLLRGAKAFQAQRRRFFAELDGRLLQTHEVDLQRAWWPG